jgi:hypothetical protein
VCSLPSPSNPNGAGRGSPGRARYRQDPPVPQVPLPPALADRAALLIKLHDTGHTVDWRAPQNKPVGYRYNADLATIGIGGFAMERSAVSHCR